ncbi:MAG: alpha-amylase [Marinoscillum sp.]|jgi:alpha-amylase
MIKNSHPSLLLLLVLLALGCNQTVSTNNEQEMLPNRWPNAVSYEIFVQSFADSNSDSIGDINGMTTKLDYLEDLGIENIWLMPINPSPSYHKYDVTDYKGIHPDYGTMDDFKNFVNESHKRNIRVTIDLVINHCSSRHPWFLSALNPSSEYRDYFIWSTKEEIEEAGNLEKAKTGDSDNTRQWNEVNGQDELYFSYFYSGMPDLNYDNPKVREEVYAIGKYWLTEVGVDGFRLDAAKHIYPDDRADDNHAFWAEFKETMESYNPDVYLVGEVWADLETQAAFAKGFDALFNFDLAFSILESVKNQRVLSASIFEDAWKINETGSPVELFNKSEKAFKNYNKDYVNTTFLTNHDQNRVMSFLGNNQEQALLAASILMTLPGAPYIYYGEEIGMPGMKPDPNIREPFLWTALPDSMRTTWMTAKYANDLTVPPLDIQMKDEGSIYNHYRSLIRTRRASEILSLGELSNVNLEDNELLAFKRSFKGNELLVLHNLSDSLKKCNIGNFNNKMFSTNNQISINSNELTLPPFQSVILSQSNK